jgi:hypothetical protein
MVQRREMGAHPTGLARARGSCFLLRLSLLSVTVVLELELEVELVLGLVIYGSPHRRTEQ